MDNKNILIVGGAGYIGGYMTDYLIDNNYNVTVYDNLLYETRFLKNVNFINGDIREKDRLLTIANDYDVVIWLAALVGDGSCAINPKLTTEINYECFKWFVDRYKKKIVFTSTCSVYGLNNDLIDEDATPNPLSVYAETKLHAEQYLLNNHDDNFIFRLGTLYGIGDLFSRIRLDLVLNVLSKKAAHKETLSVFGGEQWRPLLHVKDVTHATEYFLENNITGLYNLSSKNYTIKELAEEIQNIKPDTQVDYSDIKFEDLRNYKVKNDRLINTGYSNFIDIDEGISEIIKLFEERRINDPNDPVYSNVAFLENYL